MIYLGTNKIGKVYLGSLAIGKIYLGTTLIYEKSSQAQVQAAPRTVRKKTSKKA